MRCFGSFLACMLPLALAACEQSRPSPWSEPPQLQLDLKVAVEPLEAALLQPITVTLDRYRQDGVEVAFAPEVDGKLFRTRSTATGPERQLGDGHWQRTTLVLLPLTGPGELTLPSFVAKQVGDAEPLASASTPEQTIRITSSLAEHGAALEAPGEPFPTPFGGWWWLAGGAAALLAAAALALVLRGRRRPGSHAHEVAVPAHVKALRELQRLRGNARTTPAEIETFYVGTSQVLRVYLEERFGLHAPERTTEEFLRDLEGGDQLARLHRRELERFLSQCDLVKFAAVVPDEADHDTTWTMAQSFVESTRVDRVAATQPEPAMASSQAEGA